MTQKCNDLRTERGSKVILPPTFSPPRYFSGLVELYRYRDLLRTLTVHRIKVRYKQSILGIAWAILQPVAMVAIFTLVFTVVTRMPVSSELPYPVLVFPSLLLWGFFSTALTTATNGLVGNSQLVTKVYFPREILPLTYIFAGLVDLIIATPVLFGLMLFYRVPLTWYALYALPLVVITTLFAVGVSLILSAVQVRFRDVGVALPLLLQIWMFASPVVYPMSTVPERLKEYYLLNPMSGTIENFRRVLVEGLQPDFYQLGISAVLVLVLFAAAYIFFKRAEATVADLV